MPFEIEYTRKHCPSSVIIHIDRPFFSSSLSKDEKNHLTEIALDNYDNYDYKVINTTLESLEETAKEIIRKEEVKDEKINK